MLILTQWIFNLSAVVNFVLNVKVKYNKLIADR